MNWSRLAWWPFSAVSQWTSCPSIRAWRSGWCRWIISGLVISWWVQGQAAHRVSSPSQTEGLQRSNGHLSNITFPPTAEPVPKIPGSFWFLPDPLWESKLIFLTPSMKISTRRKKVRTFWGWWILTRPDWIESTLTDTGKWKIKSYFYEIISLSNKISLGAALQTILHFPRGWRVFKKSISLARSSSAYAKTDPLI